MTIQYTWKILNLECESATDQPCAVISKVYFKLTGTEDGFEGWVFGTQDIHHNTSIETPFASLTEQEIISITQESIGEEQLNLTYSRIDNMVHEKIFPISNTIFVPLPWISV